MTEIATAYDRYSEDRYRLSPVELEAKYPVGPEVPAEPGHVQLDVWCQIVDSEGNATGLLRRARGRKVVDIARDLKAILEAEGLVDESFGLYIGWQHEHAKSGVPYWQGGCDEVEWPNDYRWIACYAVMGDSEGHYIHIELVRQGKGCDDPDTHELVFLGKTFQGLDHAYALAKRTAELLGA